MSKKHKGYNIIIQYKNMPKNSSSTWIGISSMLWSSIVKCAK